MLQAKTISAAKPGANTWRLRDAKGGVKGLGVTIAPSGKKTFFLGYTSPIDGKRKQVAIGDAKVMSLSEARDRGRELRALVNGGKDPAHDKKQAVAQNIAARQQGTLADLMNFYAQKLEVEGKRTAKEVRRITAKDVPKALLETRADQITKDDILDILAPIVDRGAPVHADNVRTYMRAAFEFGIHAPDMPRWRSKAPCFGLQLNPVATTRKATNAKPVGHRVLSKDEINALWHTNDLSEQMLLALKMLLATGQRVEEVLGSTWDEFDLEQKLWTIPGERRKTRNKTIEPHLVPLTSLHIALLEAIKEEQRAKRLQASRYLFPARGPEDKPRRFDSLTSSVSKFVKKSGMKSFSPRDIRRTFKTRAGEAGIDLELRNRLQGHAMTDVGSVHYDRYGYMKEKRAAMEVWAGHLAEMVGLVK